MKIDIKPKITTIRLHKKASPKGKSYATQLAEFPALNVHVSKE